MATVALSSGTATARLLPPTTIDGPSPSILEFGGVAMASDGSGGVVYTKESGGAPHVFVSRYDGAHWSPPLQVDPATGLDATQPRIAADDRGKLLVVWVAPVATVAGRVRQGLFSARLGPGAAAFGPALLVDPNVGAGVGVDPSLAGVVAGKAAVAYRVVTNDFTANSAATDAVQLRPGDVMADIRLARFSGERWSRVGAINRNPASSMRPPAAANAPQVGIGAGGNAVVAWQEPDQFGAARIWVRRIFGTTVGPPLQASPSLWDGQPVSGDADALALDVTPFDQARIAARVAAGGAAALSVPRLFLGTLGPNYAEDASGLEGPVLADGAGIAPLSGRVGPPAVGASDDGGGDGSMWLAFATGGEVRQVGVDDDGVPVLLRSASSPAPLPDAEVVAAVNPEGGGFIAYESADSAGRPAVAVRQEFANGSAQAGLISGPFTGPVSQLSGARSGVGDALIGFLQGEPGHFEIVVTRASAAPAKFTASVPERWVRPPDARLRWQVAPSAVGGVTYGVLIDGRLIKSGMRGRRLRPRPALLGSGVRRVRIVATDALGGQFTTRPVRLRVDQEPPTAVVRAKGTVAVVKLRDADSGVKAATCEFGDGSKPVRGRRSCRHSYAGAGRHTITVRERDKAGNRIRRLLEVRVG
ncbi:MAG TPA: hypothetical protein VF081_12335 [Solirubrobacterales bacterium]